MKKFILLFLTMSCHLMSSPDLTWTSPVGISNTGVDASSPRIVIDANNNVTSIWLEAGVVKARTLPSGGSWGSISTLSGASSSTPQLGIASNGDIVAIWVESGVVTSATFPFGGSWSASSAVSSSSASQARLSVNSGGDAVAVWTRNGFIESSTLPSGSSWSLVSQISSGGSESNPDVAVNASGNIIAVWSSSNSGIDQVYSARGTVGGVWNSQINMLAATPALQNNYPKVAIDAQGNASAIWFRYDLTGSAYSSIDLLTATLTTGGTAWTAIPIALSSVPGLDVNPATLSICIAYDGSGNTFALWTTSIDGQSFIIQTAGRRLNSSWIVDQELAYYNLYALNADMFVNSTGNVLISYMSLDGSDISILFTETDASSPTPGVFATTQTVSQGTDNGYSRIAISNDPTALKAAIVWIQSDGTNNIIQSASGTRSLIDPPTNLAVSQNVNNFGIFNDYYNTITWDASTDPSIIFYNVYRNGSFVTALDASILEFVDHNAIQNGAVTYSIVSVNNEFLQSTPSTINFP